MKAYFTKAVNSIS